MQSIYVDELLIQTTSNDGFKMQDEHISQILRSCELNSSGTTDKIYHYG